jgi:membrane protein implicated in regulation of membrane protease activity
MTRQALGALGILLAVVGLALDVALVRWLAIGVLLVVVGWRIAERNRLRRDRVESPDSDSNRRDS